MEDSLGRSHWSRYGNRWCVLILVVMEDSLGPRELISERHSDEDVLILVVMEDSLGHQILVCTS